MVAWSTMLHDARGPAISAMRCRAIPTAPRACWPREVIGPPSALASSRRAAARTAAAWIRPAPARHQIASTASQWAARSWLAYAKERSVEARRRVEDVEDGDGRQHDGSDCQQPASVDAHHEQQRRRRAERRAGAQPEQRGRRPRRPARPRPRAEASPAASGVATASPPRGPIASAQPRPTGADGAVEAGGRASPTLPPMTRHSRGPPAAEGRTRSAPPSSRARRASRSRIRRSVWGCPALSNRARRPGTTRASRASSSRPERARTGHGLSTARSPPVDPVASPAHGARRRRQRRAAAAPEMQARGGRAASTAPAGALRWAVPEAIGRRACGPQPASRNGCPASSAPTVPDTCNCASLPAAATCSDPQLVSKPPARRGAGGCSDGTSTSPSATAGSVPARAATTVKRRSRVVTLRPRSTMPRAPTGSVRANPAPVDTLTLVGNP